MTLQSVYGASGGEPGQRCRREPAACPRHRRGVRPRGGRAPSPSPRAAKREGGTLACLISAPTPSVQQLGDAPAGAAIPRTGRMREASSIVPAPLGRGPGLSARPAVHGFSRVESRPARCRLRSPHHRRLPASPSKRQQRVGDHAVVFSLSWS